MRRTAEEKLLITFHTTADAMAMERLCKQRGIDGRLMPVPRSITSDCGIAWCMKPCERTAWEQVVQESQTEFAGIFEMMI